jgi:aldose 1-epimerase
MTVDVITLLHGADRCELYPRIGGSIGGWTVNGQQMFRAANAARIAARDAFGMASFPLVPYSNRIARGMFEWDGKLVTLARNFPPEPHSIHGVGFESPWRCTERTDSSALLTLIHAPNAGWPWPFEARQRITLAGRELVLDLHAVNSGSHPAPLAFGHHPYFPLPGAHLTFCARGVWLKGDDDLPREQVAPSGHFDFSRAAPVERADIDHCFTGWTGAARIEWPDRPLALEISGSPELSAAVVYVRSGADGFCFEPVPHINNALHLRGHEPAMPIVAPGATFSARIRFRALARCRRPS